MLATQARQAMDNEDNVRMFDKLYRIVHIKRVNDTERMVAIIERVGLNKGNYDRIDVDIECLEEIKGGK